MALSDMHPFNFPPLLGLPLAALELALLYLVLTAVYNLTLHPLARVPGPKLWAASQIPHTYAFYTGYAQHRILALHDRYGPVVRIAPNRLSFNDPAAWQAVRGHRRAGQPEHGKEAQFYGPSILNILGAPRDAHARFRRILSHGFSAKSMQEQQPLIRAYVDLLIQRLREKTADGPAVTNLVSWFNFATFDVIGDLAFGEPFGCLETGDYHPWVGAIFAGVEQFAKYLALRHYMPWVLGLSIRRSAGSGTQQQLDFAADKIAKRIESGIERPDFLQAMLGSEEKEGKLTREEVVSNARIVTLAGSETTATALSGTAYLLCKDKRVQKKLAEEVRSAFKSEDEIDVFSVQNLKYMLAVLDESMRVYPPVPAQLPRVCANGGDVICGYPVPGGTAMELWPWVFNHSAVNFKDPERFVPERWVEGSPEHKELDTGRHAAFQPFSVGPRNCIGKNLAYVEMRMIIARLIWNFDLELANEAADDFMEAKSYNLWVKNDLNIRLIPVAREKA